MRFYLRIIAIAAIAAIIIALLIAACITVYFWYQRPIPAQDTTGKNNPKSDSTPNFPLTNMFQTPATDKGMKVAIEGEKATAYVQIGDKGCPVSDPHVTCELVSELTGKTIKYLAQHVTTDHYKISYQPTSRGRHQLHINMEGEHIKGSPFPVTVIKKHGIPIKTINNMAAPQGIAFNQQGTRSLELGLPVGIGIHPLTKMIYVTDTSIDSEDVIYVTELYNNRISLFTLQGDFLYSFGRKGNGEGEFTNPRGIKVDKDGIIYVSDHGNDRKQLF